MVALVSCYLYFGTSDYLKDAAGPLVALLRSAVDVQQQEEDGGSDKGWSKGALAEKKYKERPSSDLGFGC